MDSIDTIYALSSGGLPSGVAVFRLSGPSAREVMLSIAGLVPKPRLATLRTFVDPENNMVMDKGLVLFFEGPNSFTGEDCVEFHLHGGRAVVSAFLELLSRFDKCRLAEAGEFSKRAFENGKFDLTEIEGLSDLLAAESERQRQQAISLSSGKLRSLLEGWRTRIVKFRALIEAELDFSDEEDVPGSVSDQVWSSVSELIDEIDGFIDDNHRGEIIRDGYRVVLMGAPNAGKSSLLNALAKRDVAIVSDEAGTTRDMIEVKLDIGGFSVIVTDTAGIRDTDSFVEQEGIRRAKAAGREADLVLWLSPSDEDSLAPELEDNITATVKTVRTKADLNKTTVNDDSIKHDDGITCSTTTDDGLNSLLGYFSRTLSSTLKSSENSLLTRERHRLELIKCSECLKHAMNLIDSDIVFRAEELRLAGEHIGKITGRVDVEDLLDVIFSEFCVGK